MYGYAYPMNEEHARRSMLIAKAVNRTQTDIRAMPLNQALRMDESEIMRMAVRHALAIQKEDADAASQGVRRDVAGLPPASPPGAAPLPGEPEGSQGVRPVGPREEGER